VGGWRDSLRARVRRQRGRGFFVCSVPRIYKGKTLSGTTELQRARDNREALVKLKRKRQREHFLFDWLVGAI